LGRDLYLSPKQDGQPLNYFVYPDVAGKEYANVSLMFSFAEVGSGATAGPVTASVKLVRCAIKSAHHACVEVVLGLEDGEFALIYEMTKNFAVRQNVLGAPMDIFFNCRFDQRVTLSRFRGL
jgi:hypothetical protein